VKRARAHAHVIGLQDQAALLAPEVMEGQDHVLKAQGSLAEDGALMGASL
jgi:hypothetical protein